MKILDYIKSFFEEYQNLGVLMNTEEEIAEMPNLGEIVAKANPVDWKPLDVSKFNYPVRNQNGSSSCVMATRALIWSIMYYKRTGTWIDFSFRWPYTQRTNKPDEGSYAQDVLELGMIPDDLMPSDNLSEKEMNNTTILPWLKDIGKTFLMGTPITIPVKDIDLIASVIQTTGKPVQIFVQFGPGEWTKVPKILGTNKPYGHSVTVIDYGIYEGEKALLIQDSWGKDLNTIGGKRILKESFFSKRNCFAQYFMNFKFDIPMVYPKYDGSIKSLQDCLKFEGCFPNNVSSTGVMGPITKQAITKFQIKYGLTPATGSVGPRTAEKLNQLFK